MKIISQDEDQFIVKQKNRFTTIVFILLILIGTGLLSFYLIQLNEVLLWIGLLIFIAGAIGLPFVKTISLTIDKKNSLISLKKSSLFKGSTSAYSFLEIDKFYIKKVEVEETSGEYGSGTSTYFYLMLLKKNGDSDRIFIHSNENKTAQILQKINDYFIS